MKDTRPLLLSIDTSNKWTCLGLVADGTPVGEVHLDLMRRQAGQLPIAVANFLSLTGGSFDRIETLAVTVGPGYFTGIRIGMAYASALALGLNIKVVPLSSLAVLAQSIPLACRGRAALSAASREKAFSAVWDGDQLILEEAERSEEEIGSFLRSLSYRCDIVAVDDQRLFTGQPKDGFSFITAPGGIAAASLAWQQRDLAVEPDRLRARYLKEPGLGTSS